jgi:hypothetical protein
LHSYYLRKDGRIGTRHASPLSGHSPARLVLMAETRALLRRLLHTSSVSPDLLSAIRHALSSRQRLTAPLQPLDARLALGFIDEHTHLTARKNQRPHWTTDQAYPIRSLTIPIRYVITRPDLHGAPEDILRTAHELVVLAHCDLGIPHLFAYLQPTPDDIPDYDPDTIFHPLQELPAIFHIPTVRDISAIYPARHRKNLEFLAAL